MATAVLAGAASIALGARLEMAIPGTEVPQTAQTLAVLIAGIFLGPVYGSLSVIAYVLLGVIGLPIFAGDRSGPEVLVGPTAGYLLGFLVAAAIAGRWTTTKSADRFLGAFAGMALAHSAVLFLGWFRLAVALGPGSAAKIGIEPFWLGAIVKALIAAAVCVFVANRRGPSRERYHERPD